MWAAKPEEMMRETLKAMHSGRTLRRRAAAGQSLIVAIIVLFLLLFLGGLFIALIANNLRNTRRGTQVSAADKFAEAGIRYLDQQLTTSAEGADWRPVPDNITNQRDPDYFWLKPYDPTTGEGGFTRVAFGGPTPSQGNAGGRALVRVTYRPYRLTSDGRPWEDRNGNGVVDEPGELVDVDGSNPAGIRPEYTRRYIKLESVGRSGVIDPDDPTTYQNSEGLGLRRELIAYKAIGITDYVNWITNKDNRTAPVALGAPSLVQDRPINVSGDAPAPGVTGVDVDTDGDLDIVHRPIPSIYQGPVRINSSVVFYGANYFALDSLRNDAIEVSGSISLNGLQPNATVASLTPGDPTKVYVADIRGAAAPIVPVNTFLTATTGNVVPSGSVDFNTFGGLVRDNPRGNEIAGLTDLSNAPNVRAAPRLEPPVIDAPIGDRGLTRYRLLTRDSPRLADAHTGPNPVGIAPGAAGAYGWGQGLYIPNTVDQQFVSGNLVNASSLRAEWLSPDAPNNTGSSWVGGQIYNPPAVTIELHPRYMVITRSQQDRARQYLRLPGDGRPVNGSQSTIIRYTYGPGALNAPPQVGIDTGGGTDPNVLKYAGYPAVANADGVAGTGDENYYKGDLVIFAEGNIRIKGVAGGLDPETGQVFVRNLTVVSNATIYVDGNLLKDNIPADANDPALVAARGRSSIALLAKDYVAVNTTQFLSPPSVVDPVSEQNNEQPPYAFQLSATSAAGPDYRLGLTHGPTMFYDANGLPQPGTLGVNVVPPYLSPATFLQNILFRHASENTAGTAINLFVNESALATPNEYTFPGGPQPETYLVGDSTTNPGNKFRNDVFALPAPFLFPQNAYPFGPTTPLFGTKNRLTVHLDEAYGDDDYLMSRVGVVPRDIRIEAVMYAQNGSFFIIPGPWFNPNPNDTYARYITPGPQAGLRDGEDINGTDRRIDPLWPFHGEPLDIRITFLGAIAQNLPAEIGDQGAWLEKWGWVPRYQGSSGLPAAAGAPDQGTIIPSLHGPQTPAPQAFGPTGNGIQYVYDPRASAPYVEAAPGAGYSVPIRPNPAFVQQFPGNPTVWEPLPVTPRLPVAPGLLYFGERPTR
jgi:hypothetical protein